MICSGTVRGIKPGALKVSSWSPERTSTPLEVIPEVSPSTATATSSGVDVKVTCAQSGTNAICTVWSWLRPMTSIWSCHGWKRGSDAAILYWPASNRIFSSGAGPRDKPSSVMSAPTGVVITLTVPGSGASAISSRWVSASVTVTRCSNG